MSKKNIFIDSDIILDVLLEREDFFERSAQILDLSQNRKCKLFTSVLSIANISYILRKELKSNTKVAEYIRDILDIVKALPVTEEIILKSMDTHFNDFEDSIQFVTAKSNGIDILITRNKKDYKKADIQIFTPAEFLGAEQYL